MGTIAALPFAWAIMHYGDSMTLLWAAIVVSIVGVPISTAYMKKFDAEHDPKEIVIDEVAGMWLTLGIFMVVLQDVELFHPLYMVLFFVLFRLFDIWKPWPISWADKKVGGGLGVMLDDVLAGLIAAIVGHGLLFCYFYFILCGGAMCDA